MTGDRPRRRVRIEMNEAQVNKLAQLRAHFSREEGKVVTAHLVLETALDELHHRIFEEENHEMPTQWKHYDQ